MRTAWAILALLAIATVLVSAADESTPPPCVKVEKAKLLSIEQRWPHLVKDYHPVDGAIDPNMIKDKDADRTARVIIREHLEWEKENPAPPHEESTHELKELGLKIAEQTIEIQKDHKNFQKYAQAVDADDIAYKQAEVERKKKLELEAKKKSADMLEKMKSERLQKEINDKLAANKAQKAAAEAAKAAEAAAKAKKAGAAPTKAGAGLKKVLGAAPKAGVKLQAKKPNAAAKSAASKKINDLKSKIVKNVK